MVIDRPPEARTRLSSHPTSAGAARRFVHDTLVRWLDASADDEAILLCTDELVTNAIIHVASDVELVVRSEAGVVRVEVHDASARPPLRRLPPPDAETGRGLQLVEALATRWGVSPLDTGKSVWFEMQFHGVAS
jgi:anti-sigma regulatory factor (Ser/Thr protein kinase)